MAQRRAFDPMDPMSIYDQHERYAKDLAHLLAETLDGLSADASYSHDDGWRIDFSWEGEDGDGEPKEVEGSIPCMKVEDEVALLLATACEVERLDYLEATWA